jgi:hypothetical protein
MADIFQVAAEAPSMQTISGYVNVLNTLEMEPPLTFRRWFAHVADGCFRLYNTMRSCQSDAAPMFHLVLDKVVISVLPQEHILQLTYQHERDSAMTGISFQVIIHLLTAFFIALFMHLFSPKTSFWTAG